ncbi:hypothetical protein Bca52824_097033 [Brassica carinata]|uniref:Replication factor A C-terminal domain-containing protein n=1 Tax=Brassica carinata TaxID=52824 RepID=A0A8X7NXR4_BRACI|nr:hypothetical protein Bca52824_097033 [Brassica carinata]
MLHYVFHLYICPTCGSSTDVFQRVKTGIQKKELVSTGDLHTYLSNSTGQPQEVDFLCRARMVVVLQQNEGSYVSCTGCSRKLDRSSTSFRCNKCVSPTVTGVIRYPVEQAVDAGEDNATVVVFDTEMTKLPKLETASLALEQFCIF